MVKRMAMRIKDLGKEHTLKVSYKTLPDVFWR